MVTVERSNGKEGDSFKNFLVSKIRRMRWKNWKEKEGPGVPLSVLTRWQRIDGDTIQHKEWRRKTPQIAENFRQALFMITNEWKRKKLQGKLEKLDKELSSIGP